ncbi:hypothetical protein LXA43DRAFT_736889 [Ganoderma leucocontextum]|nr:hypothetical protein LXA43DRAFT_736889 [Ganoderma leucocontextum]
MSSLPPEIWGLVIDFLQHRDQRTCLFLSRVHHNVAFSHLFSHVTVTFGLWIWPREWTHTGQLINPSNDRRNRQRMVRRNNITWEVLQAISFRPDFARVVREFTVLAHGWERGEYVFEKRCLIEALEVLPNLRVFRWYGQRPAPSSEIFEALATKSKTTLTELHMPMLEHMAPVLPRSVDRFSSLRSLSLVFPDANAGVEFNARDDAASRLLDIKDPIITRLSISGEALWGCRQPLRSFLALQELELIYTAMDSGLRDILAHCAAITSLTLLPTECTDLGQLFMALEEHRDTLPGLTSFKYLAPRQFDVATTALALGEFLKNKQCLRRLDVMFHGDHRMDYWFLELLPNLPTLEVLGFNFVRRQGEILSIERAIPAHVSALRLGPLIDLDVDDQESPYGSYDRMREGPWMKLLKSRTSLRYLHIFEYTIMAELPREDYALSVEELPSSLELFGYGLYLRPIVQESSDEASSSSISATRPVFGACWPPAKVAFRTAEDFGCADWEWLLRWHDFNGLDSLRPGVLKNGV